MQENYDSYKLKYLLTGLLENIIICNYFVNTK